MVEMRRWVTITKSDGREWTGPAYLASDTDAALRNLPRVFSKAGYDADAEIPERDYEMRAIPVLTGSGPDFELEPGDRIYVEYLGGLVVLPDGRLDRAGYDAPRVPAASDGAA